jgi:hypothetical protein
MVTGGAVTARVLEDGEASKNEMITTAKAVAVDAD